MAISSQLSGFSTQFQRRTTVRKLSVFQPTVCRGRTCPSVLGTIKEGQIPLRKSSESRGSTWACWDVLAEESTDSGQWSLSNKLSGRYCNFRQIVYFIMKDTVRVNFPKAIAICPEVWNTGCPCGRVKRQWSVVSAKQVVGAVLQFARCYAIRGCPCGRVVAEELSRSGCPGGRGRLLELSRWRSPLRVKRNPIGLDY